MNSKKHFSLSLSNILYSLRHSWWLINDCENNEQMNEDISWCCLRLTAIFLCCRFFSKYTPIFPQKITDWLIYDLFTFLSCHVNIPLIYLQWGQNCWVPANQKLGCSTAPKMVLIGTSHFMLLKSSNSNYWLT